MGHLDGATALVQPVAPHLRVRANELVFLQVLQGRSQVISNLGREYKGQAFVKLITRELPLCKSSLKNSRGQIAGPVSDPQSAAYRRASVSPEFHDAQPKTAGKDRAKDSRTRRPTEAASRWAANLWVSELSDAAQSKAASRL